MPVVHPTKPEIQFKILYMALRWSGTTTNFQYIHSRTPPDRRTDMRSRSHDPSWLCSFEITPRTIAPIDGRQVRLELTTSRGSIWHPGEWDSLVPQADGIVLLVDAQVEREDAMRDLREDLDKLRLSCAHEIPVVVQCNKLDLSNTFSIAACEDMFAHAHEIVLGASAPWGYGVFDTLRAVTWSMLTRHGSPDAGWEKRIAAASPEQLVAIIQDTHVPWPKLVALRTLRTNHPEHYPTALRVALSAPEPLVRERAVALAIDAKLSIEPEQWVALLRDDAFATRFWTLTYLRRCLEDPAWPRTLVEEIQRCTADEHALVRRLAFETLAGEFASTAQNGLIRALSDPDNWVRNVAVQALKLSRDSTLVPRLIECVANPNCPGQFDAVSVLATMGDARAIEPIQKLLEAHEEARALCTYALEVLSKQSTPPTEVS